ncbi:MAG: hypothetical protein QNJ44_22590 [Rhodobacter sp.]|nr:hypothetical protein [Rhodobacter sp.]
MTDRPILFSGPMVRAILNGQKTQTRRVQKRPSWAAPIVDAEQDADGIWGLPAKNGCWSALPIPQIGDRLWVQETWADVNWEGAPAIAFRADESLRDLMDEPEFLDHDKSFNYDDRRLAYGKHGLGFACWSSDLLNGIEGSWRSARFMPRWVSRLTLTVTDVRVQRLQEIGGEDCIAEGVDCSTCAASWSVGRSACNQRGCFEIRQNFRTLWDSLNAKRGFGWDLNPWVAAYSFTVERRNIDGAHNG